MIQNIKLKEYDYSNYPLINQFLIEIIKYLLII